MQSLSLNGLLCQEPSFTLAEFCKCSGEAGVSLPLGPSLRGMGLGGLNLGDNWVHVERHPGVAAASRERWLHSQVRTRPGAMARWVDSTQYRLTHCLQITWAKGQRICTDQPQYVAGTKLYLHLKFHVSQSPSKDPSWWQSIRIGRHHGPFSVSWTTTCFNAVKFFLLEGSNLGIIWAFLVSYRSWAAQTKVPFGVKGPGYFLFQCFPLSPAPAAHWTVIQCFNDTCSHCRKQKTEIFPHSLCSHHVFWESKRRN